MNDNFEQPDVVVNSEFVIPDQQIQGVASINDTDRAANRAAYQHSFVKDPAAYETIRRVYENPTRTGKSHALKLTADRDEEIRDANATWTKAFTASGGAGVSVGADKDLGPLEVDAQVRLGSDFVFTREFDSADEQVKTLNDKHREQDQLFLGNMRENPSELDRMTDKIVDIEAKRALGEPLTDAEQNIADVLDEMKRRDGAFPQKLYSKEGILAAAPQELRDRISEAETQEEKERIINQYFSSQTTNNINIQITQQREKELGLDELQSELSKVEDKIDKAQASGAQEQKEELERRKDYYERKIIKIKLAEHDKQIKYAQDTAYAGQQAAILLFGNTPGIETGYKAVMAGIQVYDAIGSMAINGLTTGGVGAALGGLNALSSLSGGGQDNGLQIIYESLMSKLDVLDEKLDILLDSDARAHEKMNIIINALEDIRQGIDVNFDELKARLEARDINEEARDRLQRQEAIIEDVERDAQKELTAFDVSTGLMGDRLMRCIEDGSNCDAETHEVFTAMARDLGAIRSTATQTIPSGNIFQQNAHVFDDQTSEVEIEAYMSGTDVRDRVGKSMVNMAALINERIESKQSQDGVKTSRLGRLPHPTYFYELVELYLNIASRMPHSYGYHGQTGDVSLMQDAAKKLEFASSEMREALPIVMQQYKDSVELFISSVDALINDHKSYKRGEVFEIEQTEPSEDKIDIILQSLADIKSFVDALSFDEVRDHGKSLGLFEVVPHELDTAYTETTYVDATQFKLELSKNTKKDLGEPKKRRDLVNDTYYVQKGMSCLVKTKSITTLQGYHETLPLGPSEMNTIYHPAEALPQKTSVTNCENNTLKPFKAFLFAHLSHHSQLLLADIKGGEQLENAAQDEALIRLIFNTFVEAGYGECLDYDPNMRAFRQAEFYMDSINQWIDKIKTAPSMPDLLAARNEIEKLVGELDSDAMIDTKPQSEVCELGFGNTQQAREDLQTIIDFGSYQPIDP